MEDPVGELYQLVEALDLCCRTAPVGLSFILKLLKDRLYAAVVQLENQE
ncbi:hypothetical protein [Maridesulfovibrio zosterae]|nr:hypothetical protein [Maridesulfovibrio zosterae]